MGKNITERILGGFPERARALLGCRISEPVLHVCGGCAKYYPYKRGFGPNDKTLDLDPQVQPDFLQDAKKPFPWSREINALGVEVDLPWAGILIDPPYSEEDCSHYNVGKEAYPSPSLLVKNAFAVLPVGGRVGIIHYIIPKAPTNSIFVACIGVVCGFNNRIRVYSVYEKV